jgi:hypothetical protein
MSISLAEWVVQLGTGPRSTKCYQLYGLLLFVANQGNLLITVGQVIDYLLSLHLKFYKDKRGREAILRAY